MTKNFTNYDLLYSTEYEKCRKIYLEGMRLHFDDNSNKTHLFLKVMIQESLRTTLLKYRGKKVGNGEQYDQYFEWLCSDIDKARRNYKVNPISNFIQNEYQALRKESASIRHVKPKIYNFDESDTITHFARFEALNNIFIKLTNLTWSDSESSLDFLKNFEVKAEVTRGRIANVETSLEIQTTIDDRINKVLHAPTTYAVVYFIMNRTDHKDFPWDDNFMKAYLKKVNTEIPTPQYQKIKLDSFIRTVYKMIDKIETVRLPSLEAAKINILKYHSEKATDMINKHIAGKLNSDRY